MLDGKPMPVCAFTCVSKLLQTRPITASDFPLPTLGPLLSDILENELGISDSGKQGRGWALLRGLPVEKWTRVSALA